MTDTLGNAVGPYRVWKGTHNFPGLAMSRSIGDKVGDEIGVFANPIVSKVENDPSNDQFYILASDGIWDALSNEEAINFVSKHRAICKRRSTYKADEIASTSNCSIS
jgi:serine/threonine protein phosphatase PrpC